MNQRATYIGHRTPFGGGSGIGYRSRVRLEASGLRVLGCQTIGDILVPAGA